MAPMTRSRADNKELAATDMIAEYYCQRASAGLIISEGTNVNPMGIGYINVPNIYSEAQIEGWKKTTKAVHDKGGKIFAQLWHVGRVSHTDLLDGKLPLAPSAVNPHSQAYTPKGFADTVAPKAMTQEEIDQTITDFKNAVLNSFEAGFDGVELHAANGYLFHQFFSKQSNLRNDNYGGSIENRARFLFETLDAIAEISDMNRIGIRLAPALDGNFGIDKDDETDAIFEYIVNRLNDYDLAYLHISGIGANDDTTEDILKTAKKYRAIYKGIYMINKVHDRDTANKAIEDGIADIVSFGELYIANPDLVERFEKDAPLNEGDRDTYYTPGAKGYIDYPFMK